MRKIILFSSLFTSAFGAIAQVENGGFADYFNTSAAPDKIIYWGDNDQYGIDNARTGNGSLDLIVTKDASTVPGGNVWAIMGFVTSGTIDISTNPMIQASFTNKGNTGVEVYFDFVSNETSGSNIEFISGSVSGEAFGGVISAGETVVFTFDLVGAKKRTWVSYSDTAACDALQGPPGVLLMNNSCMQDFQFDPANLSKLEFAIVGEIDPDNNWEQSAITNHSVSINYITGGTKVVGLFSVAEETQFEVFPNPANVDIIGFSKELTNIVVMNALGSIVFEAPSESNLNVSSFEAGMYILKSDEGSTKIMVE